MSGNQQNFSAAMNAADRYRWDSRWNEAAQEYRKALAEFPEDAATRSGLGFCYMQTRQWQQALDEYENVLEHDPDNIIALSKTAELYGILSRRADAYKAYMRLADLYAQGGQGARSEAAWQKSVQVSPHSPEPHERLAQYYFEKKDIPAMIQQRLAAARAYLLRNEFEAARSQCQSVLWVDSTNVQAQQLITQVADRAGSAGDGGHNAQGSLAGSASGPLAITGNSQSAGIVTSGNISGGNTGIMGNMGSAGNFGGVNNQGPTPTMVGGGGTGSTPRMRITANQVTEALKQAQLFQEQGRFNDAIDLCEQILSNGFDRPDARYFLGWLYQEQQRWDEAIRQFQLLLNDPDYALSCYYALGQCYRARGDLRSATVHFDEAVDRVNLDALTLEEADQLVQLCQEAAEAHRMLGEQEQALTVYNALLGFLRSRGWGDKVSQVEMMLKQAQSAPPPTRPVTPPPTGSTPGPISQPGGNQPGPPQTTMSDASTMMFNPNSQQNMPSAPQMPPTQQAPYQAANNGNQMPPTQQAPGASASGELPDWLTGILSEPDKTMKVVPNQPPAPAQPQTPPQPPMPQNVQNGAVAEPASPSWLTDGAKPDATVRMAPSDRQPIPPAPQPPAPPQQQAIPTPPAQTTSPAAPQQQAWPATAPQPPQQAAWPPPPAATPPPPAEQPYLAVPPASEHSSASRQPAAEDLLSQIAGNSMDNAAEAVLASTAGLPDTVRAQVVRSMQDIQKYISHGLLNSATEECLRVIDMAPQYLDVHQVLCEIYVREGKIEQAITKYAILVDTYIVNGRVDDAVTTYRRILQLDPNNLKYRMRLIELLASQGDKEDLLRERTLAAESYLRLGYMDRAVTELEQALKESPTSVPTRLNYALALQKLGRSQQAVTEYQRVLQIDPRNLTALIRWHIAMTTSAGTPRSTTLEILSRIRWQLRGEGQRLADMVQREYKQAIEVYPNNADLYFALGQVYQQCGQFNPALDAYMQAAARDGSVEILARASAAQSLLIQGKPEAAIDQLDQALQMVRRTPTVIDPATWAARPREEGEQHKAPEVELSTQLATAYERSGRVDQKEAIMRQLKQTRPTQSEVASAMAEISSRQGDIGSALQEYMDLVRHYRNNRQGDNALSVLNEMVRLAPQDPRAHDELADIYLNRGMLDEGIAELRLLADIHLRNGQNDEASAAIQRMGNIYAEMGNPDDALAALCRAAELNPNSMDLLREVVSLFMQQGRNREAARYQSTIARHYFETQQVKESVAALQQLIAIDRNNYDAYDMLGQTYQSVGEYEQASRVYRNLAKVNPSSPVARDRLATLQNLRSR
jgi:tetratricopeptide (TPR) repeat protein